MDEQKEAWCFCVLRCYQYNGIAPQEGRWDGQDVRVHSRYTEKTTTTFAVRYSAHWNTLQFYCAIWERIARSKQTVWPIGFRIKKRWPVPRECKHCCQCQVHKWHRSCVGCGWSITVRSVPLRGPWPLSSSVWLPRSTECVARLAILAKLWQWLAFCTVCPACERLFVLRHLFHGRQMALTVDSLGMPWILRRKPCSSARLHVSWVYHENTAQHGSGHRTRNFLITSAAPSRHMLWVLIVWATGTWMDLVWQCSCSRLDLFKRMEGSLGTKVPCS